MILTWVKNLRIRQPLNVMTRLLAPRSTIALVLVLCIASVASMDPTFEFPNGIKSFPDCGIKAGFSKWSALGTLKGDITIMNYDTHDVEVWVQDRNGVIGSPCSLDLTDCTSTPPDTQDFICYCAGSTTGTGSMVFNITATAIAEQSENEVKGELKSKPNSQASYVEFDIGFTPVIYEEVVPTIEIDDGGKQLLTPVIDITFVTSSPTIKVEFCATHLQLPGGEISTKSGFFLEQECVTDEWASNTSALHFLYRQPDFTLPCDTGKSFTIKLTRGGSNTSTDKHGSTNEKPGSTNEKPGSTTEKHGSTTEKQSNGCHQVKMNKLWIAALATSFIFLA